MSTAKIFADPSALVPHIDRLRAAGQTIVFGNGCFDIIHVGHVNYLQAARELGDVLIVAVNTDASMRINKPDRPPITPECDRFAIVAAMEAVDYVVPLDEKVPYGLIRLFRPHIQAKGTDYTLDRMPERELVESLGGRIEFVGGPKVNSSSIIREQLARKRTS